MPRPSNPPPESEAGARTSPRQLQRWLDCNVVHPLTRTATYIQLPAFSIESTWRGYSEIIGAYNFTGSRNFSLKQFDIPVNPNYCLCIMWVDDELNVHRYKLWEDVGEVFYFDVPLYTNQQIKKNFRFEVWNTNTTTFTSFNLFGSTAANVNGLYTKFDDITYFGPVVICYYSSVDNRYNLIAGINSYEHTGTFNPAGKWDVYAGPEVAPSCETIDTYVNASALTFYTSVLGNYDYRYQDDSVLVNYGTLVTDFGYDLVAGVWPLPLTWPASSVPATN